MGWLIDWLNKKGEEFMDHHSNTTQNSGAFQNYQGNYNIHEALANDNPQPMQDSIQETLDQQNTSKGAPTFEELIQRFNNGEITALELQAIVAQYNMKLNGYQEAWMNNMIAQQNTQSDRDYQTEQRDTSLLSTYEQLQKLGMNPSSVINLGGASSGVSSQAAPTVKSDVARMQFDRQTQMAKTMIGLAGGLASTGVHGAALGAARFAASKLTAEASKYATDKKYGGVTTTYYDPENHSSHKFYTY